MIKLAVLAKALAVAELFSSFSNLVFGDSEPKTKNKRKPADTTPLTDYHKAVIRAEHQSYVLFNKTHKRKMNTQELTSLINAKLGLNKSVRTYSRIWNSED